MFAMTKAETGASLTGPRPDFKSPQKPSTPASMTTPAASYRRVPAQADATEARHYEQMKASADARTALRDSIKAVHQSGGAAGAFGLAGPVIL